MFSPHNEKDAALSSALLGLWLPKSGYLECPTSVRFCIPEAGPICQFVLWCHVYDRIKHC